MLIFEIITAVISIASLVGLIYQSMNLQETIDSQIYQNFVSHSLDIDRILIERPYLRKYVYYKAEIEEDMDPERLDELMSFIEMIVDIAENVDEYKKHIPKSRRDGWKQFFHDVKSSPAYAYYMERHASWYVEKNEHKKT